jgi:hypothetical protein
MFATSATVEVQGRVVLAGVPFAPGTEVEITISPKVRSQDQTPLSNDPALTAARDRMRELFHTTHGFRNSPRIPREELYERGSLR